MGAVKRARKGVEKKNDTRAGAGNFPLHNNAGRVYPGQRAADATNSARQGVDGDNVTSAGAGK